jgi:hypothetical protein
MVHGFLLISIPVIIFVVVLKDHIYNHLPQSIADLKNKILAITLWTIYFLGGGGGGGGGCGLVMVVVVVVVNIFCTFLYKVRISSGLYNL